MQHVHHVALGLQRLEVGLGQIRGVGGEHGLASRQRLDAGHAGQGPAPSFGSQPQAGPELQGL